jgi:hypothetical protein
LHFSRNFQSTLSYNTWFGHSSVMLFSIHKFMLIITKISWYTCL